MSNFDVYQLVDTQLLAGQKCLNVYFYQMTDAPAGYTDAAAVTAGFIANMLPLIKATQVTDLTHISVKASNLFDDSDAHEELISIAGTADAGYNTTFDSFGFRLTGDNAAVRSGSKRIAGVTDSAVTDGVVTNAPLLVGLNALAAAMAAPVDFGLLDAGSLLPVIVKRILTAGEYGLPTSLEEAVLSFVFDALFDTFITSQVSRKIGRGE